ncbi:MAG: ice-binding family protein [Acidimicrobiales bacterium]
MASVLGMAGTSLVLLGTAFVPVASAASTVDLGTAAPFAVLAYSAVTDVPTSSITGDVGLSPAAGSNYAGLTKAEVDGTIYTTNAAGPTGYTEDPGLLTTAKNDLTNAFTSANGQPATTTYTTGDNQLGGKTLTPGVYAFGAAATANITAASPLVLDGNGVFIFQASSSLVTASGSVVRLEGGAQACNVFWTVGSSATLGSSSTFVGTLMALTSATLNSGATVQGRILAQNAAVTLDANTITLPPTCLAVTPPTTTTTTAPGATTTTTAPGATTTTTAAGSGGSGGPGGSGGTAAGTAGTAAGGGGGTGSGTSGAGGTTGSGATGTGGTGVVPVGFPHTGLGGAAHGRDDDLIVLGALALAGAAGAAFLAVRRRRFPLVPVRTSGGG